MTAVLSPLRKDRITGSRVAAILGVSPYASRDDVMRDMVRDRFGAPPEFVGNRATDWGNTHEADGVEAWEREHGQLLDATGADQVFRIHPQHEWLGATPDGVTFDGAGGAEVKCPYWGNYTTAAEVPWYEIQCRTITEAAQLQWIDLTVWRPGGTTFTRIDHDPTWFPGVQAELEDFLADYLSVVERDDLAAPFLQPLVDVRTDPEWLDAAARWLELSALAKVAATAAEDARLPLVGLAAGRSTRGVGVSVNVTERKGSVDMKRAIAENAPTVDLEVYRKPPTVVASVRGVLS